MQMQEISEENPNNDVLLNCLCSAKDMEIKYINRFHIWFAKRYIKSGIFCWHNI